MACSNLPFLFINLIVYGIELRKLSQAKTILETKGNLLMGVFPHGSSKVMAMQPLK